jgi:hypothetical protein
MCASCFSLVVGTRLVLRPFTFSNGVTIPAGAVVSIPVRAVHTDERIFENPNEFDGFRFAKLRENGAETNGLQMTSTSVQNLSFGVGRHAWWAFLRVLHPWYHFSISAISPGRFFAVNETKVLLSHLIVTYDMKFEEGKRAPPELRIGASCVPRTTNVLFRARRK